jgi:hypothetical protein
MAGNAVRRGGVEFFYVNRSVVEIKGYVPKEGRVVVSQ